MKILLYDPDLLPDPAADQARLECAATRAVPEIGNPSGYAVEWAVEGRVLVVPGPLTRPALRAQAPEPRTLPPPPAPTADELVIDAFLAAATPTVEETRAAVRALIRERRSR